MRLRIGFTFSQLKNEYATRLAAAKWTDEKWAALGRLGCYAPMRRGAATSGRRSTIRHEGVSRGARPPQAAELLGDLYSDPPSVVCVLKKRAIAVLRKKLVGCLLRSRPVAIVIDY